MKALSVFASLALGIALLGCGKGNFSKTNNAVKSGVFRYTVVTSPTTMDPAKVQDGDTIDLVQQVFEGLVRWGDDNRVQPALAEKWDIVDGGTDYVFHLKKGAKFSNGREVHADDFKWCIERACNPDFNSPTAGTYLTDVVGVSDRLARKAEEVKGIQVIDDYTLKIQIDKPRPYFIGKLTYPIAYAYAKEAVKNPLKELGGIDEMVGTGPFVFEKYVPDQIVTMVANKAYHDGAPKLERIERPIVKDAATRLNLFKSGAIDLVQLERQDVEGLQKDATFKDQLHFFDRASMWYVGINLKQYPAFKDVRVRQAMAQAIDIDDIITNIFHDINKKADGIVPPGVFGHQDHAAVWKFDVTAAKKLLADAGYPDGKGLPEFEMTLREARPDIQIVAEKVASDLKQNLGIRVKLKTMEWRAYLEKNNQKIMPFFHMRWGADYLDAENFLSTLLATYGAENKVNYSNKEFDALCREADTTLDEAKRLELYAKAENIALKEAPFIPIYFQRDAELISPRVKGIRDSLFGHLPHTTVSVE
jgi:oligopeptide transport system substrate-binding protein